MKKSYQAPTVRKAFQILSLVCEANRGVRITDLSRRLKISKSTVHGIVSVLEDVGALVRNPKTKSFTPGVTLFELGKAAFSRIDLKPIAHPVMETLMQKAQESVFLGIKNGEYVTILDIVESPQDLKITAPIGTRIPLLAGATGKVFMASMPDEEIHSLVQKKGIRKYTEHTITDPTLFLKEIHKARKDEFALDDEEYISGVRAVAVPIRSENSQVSAIWVVGFKPRMNRKKMAALVKETRRAAEIIRMRIQTQPSASSQ
ncbi:MAG: IclR family transcriptional regulator [Thermodesulfobacteriota bacterium]